MEPKRRTREHYIVLVVHIAAAFVISAFQLNSGIDAWFPGFGLATPILLIIHGVVYSFIQISTWCREQMVPFMLKLVPATEIETDRYVEYNRKSAMYVLIFGWFAILLCQFVWTFGLTEVMPFFIFDDFILRLIGEIVGYIVIFGPFLLYFLLLIAFAWVIEEFYLPGYNDVEHLFEIAHKWGREHNRRAKNLEPAKDVDDPYDEPGI